MQEYVKHLLDGCYLLFVEYLQEKKNISLCPETVPRKEGQSLGRESQCKEVSLSRIQLGIFWMNNKTIGHIKFCKLNTAMLIALREN